MKTIPTAKSRNRFTQEAIDELHLWIEEYITDETAAFAVVSVRANGSATLADHKSACGGAITREHLAMLAHKAIAARDDTLEAAVEPGLMIDKQA